MIKKRMKRSTKKFIMTSVLILLALIVVGGVVSQLTVITSGYKTYLDDEGNIVKVSSSASAPFAIATVLSDVYTGDKFSVSVLGKASKNDIVCVSPNPGNPINPFLYDKYVYLEVFFDGKKIYGDYKVQSTAIDTRFYYNFDYTAPDTADNYKLGYVVRDACDNVFDSDVRDIIVRQRPTGDLECVVPFEERDWSEYQRNLWKPNSKVYEYILTEYEYPDCEDGIITKDYKTECDYGYHIKGSSNRVDEGKFLECVKIEGDIDCYDYRYDEDLGCINDRQCVNWVDDCGNTDKRCIDCNNNGDMQTCYKCIDNRQIITSAPSCSAIGMTTESLSCGNGDINPIITPTPTPQIVCKSYQEVSGDKCKFCIKSFGSIKAWDEFFLKDYPIPSAIILGLIIIGTTFLITRKGKKGGFKL